MVLAPDSARLQREIEFVLQVFVGQRLVDDVVCTGDALRADGFDFGALDSCSEISITNGDTAGVGPGRGIGSAKSRQAFLAWREAEIASLSSPCAARHLRRYANTPTGSARSVFRISYLDVYDDVGLRPGNADEDAARLGLVERLLQIFHLSFH